MRPSPVAILLVALLATPAHAQLNLAWNNCITQANAAGNMNYACNGLLAGIPFKIVPSFVAPAGVTQFIGVELAIELSTSNPVLPDYWRMGPGECRDGTLNFGQAIGIGTGTTGACQNPFGALTENGYSWVSGSPSADRGTFTEAPARSDGSVLALTPGQQYFVFPLIFDPYGDADIGDGHVCPGCSTAACFQLKSLKIYQMGSSVPTHTLTSAATRNYVTWQGGTANCAGATPARNATWGAIKAIYR